MPNFGSDHSPVSFDVQLALVDPHAVRLGGFENTFAAGAAHSELATSLGRTNRYF